MQTVSYNARLVAIVSLVSYSLTGQTVTWEDKVSQVPITPFRCIIGPKVRMLSSSRHKAMVVVAAAAAARGGGWGGGRYYSVR